MGKEQFKEHLMKFGRQADRDFPFECLCGACVPVLKGSGLSGGE